MIKMSRQDCWYPIKYGSILSIDKQLVLEAFAVKTLTEEQISLNETLRRDAVVVKQMR